MRKLELKILWLATRGEYRGRLNLGYIFATYCVALQDRDTGEIPCGGMVTRLLTNLHLDHHLPYCKPVGDADSVYLDMKQLGQIQFISKHYEWLRDNKHGCYLL